jgi:hypothetical protein
MIDHLSLEAARKFCGPQGEWLVNDLWDSKTVRNTYSARCDLLHERLYTLLGTPSLPEAARTSLIELIHILADEEPDHGEG